MLGAATDRALPFLRTQAESLMQDACVIRRVSGSTMDPVTLEETPAYEPVWSGRCRVQRPGSTAAQQTVAGAVEFGVNTVLAQLPLTAVGVERGDRFEVTAVGPLSDPALLGLVATVQANLTKTHPTKRTLICEEVT